MTTLSWNIFYKHSQFLGTLTTIFISKKLDRHNTKLIDIIDRNVIITDNSIRIHSVVIGTYHCTGAFTLVPSRLFQSDSGAVDRGTSNSVGAIYFRCKCKKRLTLPSGAIPKCGHRIQFNVKGRTGVLMSIVNNEKGHGLLRLLRGFFWL